VNIGLRIILLWKLIRSPRGSCPAWSMQPVSLLGLSRSNSEGTIVLGQWSIQETQPVEALGREPFDRRHRASRLAVESNPLSLAASCEDRFPGSVGVAQIGPTPKIVTC
jgi:hypothetical protein